MTLKGRAAHARVDACLGDYLVEVKTHVHGLRDLRAALIQLVYALEADPGRKGLLVLVEPRLSEGPLGAEMASAARVLRPGVFERVSVVVVADGRTSGLPEDFPATLVEPLRELIHREAAAAAGTRVARPLAFYVVLQVLTNSWMLGAGPMTTKSILEAAGCSYPTAAKALAALEPYLHRHSDRRVELSRFPRDAWERLVAVADEVRSTKRFVDRSGEPRAPESLLRRVAALGRSDVAVGGVAGALYYHPRLDLVAPPRLDLVVHSRGRTADLGFVERLDPALREAGPRGAPANLVIHFARREASLFQTSEDGLRWAAPVDCLLDLHDARLEPQALEFLRAFSRRRAGASVS